VLNPFLTKHQGMWFFYLYLKTLNNEFVEQNCPLVEIQKRQGLALIPSLSIFSSHKFFKYVSNRLGHKTIKTPRTLILILPKK
jgi:hypothetical protein